MDDDQPMIDAARGGDAAAFERIVTGYSGPIVRYICNLVGDQHAAEDVAQSVFLKVYRNLDRFDTARGKFSTWIYRIARNAALNYLRDHKQHAHRFETSLPPESSELTPQAQAEMREQFALLDNAVAALPEHQRSAWVLSELEGLTQSQIARVEGIPEGTVKSRVSRARETLKKSLTNTIGLER